jgi:hypothetical protein
VNAIFEQGHFGISAQVVEEAQILSIPLALLIEQIQVNYRL